MSVLINPATEAKLAALTNDLPHAVLLTGPHGVGLATIARRIAGKQLASFLEPLDTKGDIQHSTGTISVTVIRELYEQTRSKQSSRQVFIIDDADRMSLSAQAAFLKLLEEPTSTTHFILTSHTPQELLPTVRSRVQRLEVDPVTYQQTRALIDTFGVTDTKKRSQLEYLGVGLPAELMRLSMDENYFTGQAEIMSDTRQFLTGTPYQKLLIIHKYYQNKQSTIRLIDSALTISRRSLAAKPQSNLISQLDRLLSVRENIEANRNIRLQLMAFVVY